MVADSLKNKDVDALLTLRADVERALADRGRDLQRQLALLGSGRGKRRGRPLGGARRPSAMKGIKIAPKYRGPGGETWAGRGAQPRWLTALVKKGHSIEEFAIGRKGGRAAAAAAKKSVRRNARKPGRKKKAAA
jgi:DNA-binding protein H-NS